MLTSHPVLSVSTFCLSLNWLDGAVSDEWHAHRRLVSSSRRVKRPTSAIPPGFLSHRLSRMAERRYLLADFDGLKREDLVGLVLKQSDRWPKSAHGPFRRWKTNMDTMKNVLVGSAFTTTSPLPSTLSSTVETPPASDTVQNDAADVLAALQALISVIVGSAKIGVPDEHDAAYLQFFAVIANSKSPSPEAFGGRLLRDPMSSSSSVPPSGPLSGLLSFPESVPGEHSAVAFLPANPSLLSSSKRASSPVQFTEQQMTWLKRKAEASEGYEEFARHHNKQLSNLQHVEYWKFAADFSHRYYKAPWPADVPRSGSSKIQRPAIASALGMGLTALNQAINLARILDAFYFGAQRSEDVARMVEDKEQVGAADVLVDFLTGWAQSHPETLLVRQIDNFFLRQVNNPTSLQRAMRTCQLSFGATEIFFLYVNSGAPNIRR
ncbi:hypothetical protein C8F01DRAFT_1094635 [Mycena amicta]|nr:hypothetical protein C8F01DRAFT_1094635 [Mycena amicta]